MKFNKFRLIIVLLITSIIFNLLCLGFGFAYLKYTDLSVSYAFSMIPNILGITNDDNPLKKTIVKEYPGLEMSDTSDYEKITILRHWAARVVDYSDYSLLFDIRIHNFSQLSPYEMYDLFINNRGGVWCEGTGIFLKKIYELFGFKSYTLSYGTLETVTHLLNLVIINYEGKEILSVQDAYFDETYETSNGEPIDYFAMLELLKEKRDDEILIVKTGLLMRDFHYETSTGIITKHDPFTIDSITINFDNINTFLINRGFPPKIIYLHLFPYQISSDLQYKIFNKASSITGWPLKVENH